MKAPDGSVFVESDYQTAEIRGLAIISGDVNLTRMITGTNPEYGILEETGEPIRLKYLPEDQSGIKPEHQDPMLIMARKTGDGVWEKIQDSQLKRDASGNLLHPKYDLHWSLAEMVQNKPREVLNAKLDRGGIGKVGNFSCFPDYAEVIRDSEPIKLKDLSDNPLLPVWDGEEYVRYETKQYQGERQFITYDGLTATPEHVVWIEDGSCCCLVDAAMARLKLYRPGISPEVPLADRYLGTASEREALEDRVRHVRSCSMEVVEQCEAGERSSLREMLSEGEVQRSQSRHARETLSGYATEMPQDLPCVRPQLSGTWDRSKDGARGVHTLGSEDMAGRDVQVDGLRQDRQRRSLRDIEPATHIQIREPSEQERQQELEPCTCGEHPQEQSEDRLHTRAYSEPNPKRTEYSSDTGAGGEAEVSYESTHYREESGEYCSRSECTGTTCVVAPRDGDETRTVESHSGNSNGVHRHRRGFSGSEGSGTTNLHAIPTPGTKLSQDHLSGLGCEGLESGTCVSAHREAGEEADCDRRSYDRREHLVALCERHDIQKVERWYDRDGNPTTSASEVETRVAPAYDLINCGPRRRFVADGVLVSNSAYGATDSTLERKIESDTGVKPEEGTGEKLLGALRKRQPRAFEYLEECELIPETAGFIRALSGRVKHCVVHDRSSGVNYRTRSSIASAQGRECRNYECQESVASTAARAGKWLMDFCIAQGLKSRPITILYDSVVTQTPLEERFVVRRLHDLFMHELNTWDYPANPEKGIEARTLSYPIDNEFNYRWSTGPSEEELELLEDESWHPTPEHLRYLLTADIRIVAGVPTIVG